MSEINSEIENNLLHQEEEYQLPLLDDLNDDLVLNNKYNFQLFDSINLNAKGILNIKKKNDSTKLQTEGEEDVFYNTSLESCNQSSIIDFSIQDPENIRLEEERIENFSSAKSPSFIGKEKQKKEQKLSLLSKKIKKNENSMETEKLSKAKSQAYPVKNLLKIIGNSIISKIRSNTFLDKNILEQKTKKYGINTIRFSEWVNRKNYINTFVNFESFRLLFTDSNEDENDKACTLVLRDLTLWFLENEIYSCFIFEKKFKVDVTLYLEKFPKILDGLRHPKSFYSLK